MKKIERLFVLSLIVSFTVFLSSCSSSRGFKKGRSKGKRGCNCPTFTADAMQQVITLEEANRLELS